jgi:hypothetical protein
MYNLPTAPIDTEVISQNKILKLKKCLVFSAKNWGSNNVDVTYNGQTFTLPKAENGFPVGEITFGKGFYPFDLELKFKFDVMAPGNRVVVDRQCILEENC